MTGYGAGRKAIFGVFLAFMWVQGWSAPQSDAQRPVWVAGGGGIKLAIYEYGDPRGPAILLVHGFSQSHLSWSRQYRSAALQRFRIVAIDLRGHGASGKPTDPESYKSGKVWADDINAVVKAKKLRKPLLVGWSYGGLIIGDYLREYGDGDLGGIVFVDASTQLGTEDAKPLFGPGMTPLYGMLDPRQEINIPSTAQFVKECTLKPLSAKEYEEVFAYNMAVPPEVRQAMSSRMVDSKDALMKIRVPVLIIHGAQDRIILPAAGNYIAQRVKHAKKSYYSNAGHSPFMEDPRRFNDELAAMADYGSQQSP